MCMCTLFQLWYFWFCSFSSFFLSSQPLSFCFCKFSSLFFCFHFYRCSRGLCSRPSPLLSTLLLLLIFCLIPLLLFIYMLMTHNSIFLFPLLIFSLVSLLSLLLSILSTIGLLPIVSPLIHQKLNSSSLVPPSSVSSSPPSPLLFAPPFFLQLLTVETSVSCPTVIYPSTSTSLPFALLLSITFSSFVRSALFSIALPQFSLPMLSFLPNSITAILFFLVSLFIPFGDSSLSKTLLLG